MAGAIIAGAALFGVVGASAASLGGITGSLGADAQAVSSCDTDGIALSYTNAYDATVAGYTPLGAYKTSSVTVNSINAACNGKNIKLTLKDSTGASIGGGSGTVASGAATFALSPTIDPKLVVGAAAVISD